MSNQPVAAPTSVSQRPGAVIVGASSGIGAALARTLARDGYAVALVARRADRLDELAREINSQAHAPADAPVARAYVHDVCHYDEAPALFQRVLDDLRPGGLAALIYAAGVMPPPDTSAAWDFAQERAMLETNTIGASRWLGLAADAFRSAGRGTLVGISSLAGERGRRGNSAYQASKAALSTYLESLRYRLKGSGVRVVTIKPGYVATEMTSGLGLPRPLVTAPERIAARIARACRGGPEVVYVPAYWGPIAWVVRHLPAPLMTRLPL
jgi:short-subunit dehydrogenase